jgi:hypothetical protein
MSQMKNPLVIGVLALALAITLLPVSTVFAAEPGRGSLFYNGTVVRTIVPPAAFPHQGIDNFYKVTNGANGQLGIASVAPGNPAYHGGHWKVFTVTFNEGVTPSLLTSESAVLSAQTAGSVTVTRAASADFLCPIQP